MQKQMIIATGDKTEGGLQNITGPTALQILTKGICMLQHVPSLAISAFTHHLQDPSC